jgi:hypothetical protein
MAPGNRARLRRRLKLGEALRDHPPADGLDDMRPKHDVVVQALAAQIQEPVAEAYIFRVIQVAEDGQR